MTDMQMLTLALAVIVPLSLLLLSNSRISDARLSLDGKISDTRLALDGKISDTRVALDTKINDTRDLLRAEMRAQHVEVIAKLGGLEAFLREAVMGKLDELDRRLTDLERRQG